MKTETMPTSQDTYERSSRGETRPFIDEKIAEKIEKISKEVISASSNITLTCVLSITILFIISYALESLSVTIPFGQTTVKVQISYPAEALFGMIRALFKAAICFIGAMVVSFISIGFSGKIKIIGLLGPLLLTIGLLLLINQSRLFL